jgi:hypothetical protein
MNESPTEPTLARPYSLLGQAVLLPIPKGEKAPRIKDWQNITYEATQTLEYQGKLLTCVRRGGNIGVLLGPASGGLGAIDVDDDDQVEELLRLNAAVGLANTLRSRGRRGCQFWIRPKGAYPNSLFDKKQGRQGMR